MDTQQIPEPQQWVAHSSPRYSQIHVHCKNFHCVVTVNPEEAGGRIADVKARVRLIEAAPEMAQALIDVATNCNDTISREAAKRVLRQVGIEL